MNKASGGDGILAELFQILKDDAVKVLPSICQQIWKTQQWPQDRKRSVFIPFQQKGNAKECSNNCDHFPHQQGNAQNTLSYASTVCDSLIPGVQARLADEQDTNLSTSTR